MSGMKDGTTLFVIEVFCFRAKRETDVGSLFA